ncbi:MAG TPA: cyclic nucleotide-binding domain-containing protein, partial [Roseateles sp.]|nr:cyclic nucleotide-binding domain-containing protein [Roseateles sp.]
MAISQSEAMAPDEDTGPEAGGGLEAPYSTLESRWHQMFPQLGADDMARVRRFGTPQSWRAGEKLFAIGDTGRGMYLIGSGRVRLMRRDGLGREHQITEQGAGHFLAEVGTLSGRPALVDGVAVTDTQGYVITPERLRALLVAEAELGERIMRALILRRVGLIEFGSGPVLVGHGTEPQLVALQAFLRRNGYPHTVIDIDAERDCSLLLD